jgi:hypothetical protein
VIIVVTNDDKDYSEFVGNLRNAGSIFSILAGFTLTTLVLVLSLFSERSAFLLQVTFYLLTFLFYLFIFLQMWAVNLGQSFIKNFPTYTLGMKICSFLEFLGISLLGLVIPVLFAFLNLLPLSILSIITLVIFVASGYFFMMKPYKKIREPR